MYPLYDKRKSGLSLVGDLAWGSDFCLFYQTTKELLEVLAPYFRAGLENNEYCVWVTSDTLGHSEAKKVLKDALPHFEKYSKSQIEIIPYSKWKAKGGKSDRAFISRLDRAVYSGFDGLRLAWDVLPGDDSGSESSAANYSNTISRYNAIAVFMYPRDKFDTLGLIDVVKQHRFALVNNAGRWEVIESSEARITKDTLQRTDEKLKSLFNNMSEGFAYHRIVLGPRRKPCDYIFLEVNEAFEKLTGLKAKRVIGKRVTKVLPGIEKDPTDWIGKYGKVALTGKPVRFESYSEQLQKWYSVSAFSPHKGYFAVTFSDVTERKKAEEALRESEQRWATTLSSIGDAVISTDAEGRITFMNAVAESLTGWTLDEILAEPVKKVFNIVNEHSRADVENPLTKALTEGRIAGLANHTILVRKDGTEVPIDDSGAPIRDQDGNIIGAVLVFRDITERKRKDNELKEYRDHLKELVHEQTAELRKSDEMLREAQRMAHLGSWELDLTTNTLLWSDEIYRIFDLDPKAFGASYEAFINAVHPEDREFVNKAYNDSVKNRTNYDIIHRLLMKDSSVKFVNERCKTYYDKDGKPLRSLGTVMDITDRVRAEEENRQLEVQLRQSQKLEALGQLAGGIAHDFNNRLAAITNFASVIKIKMDSDDPLRKQVDLLLSSANKAAQLTHNLLRFSRKEVTDLIPVDINRLMEDSVKFLRRMIREDINFSIELSDASLVAMANADLIDNLLMNLAINAGDAMPQGGSLTMTTELSRIDETFVRTHGFGLSGDYALISVTDTGSGMDETTRERIFEPFFTTKEVGSGTGLGLSIVYGIVKQHSGYINAYSEPGIGTTFNIFLPLAASGVQAKETVEESLPGGTETILLAEDELEVRESVKSLLETFGYRVIEALDGEDALMKFVNNENTLDLLLLDVVMPKMNGMRLFEEILKIRPDIKALFMSGYPAEPLQENIDIPLQKAHFVYKPVSHDILLKNVRKILDGRKGS